MTAKTTAARRLTADFWKFWAGQTISNLGSSITLFALPLLVFKLTGSALDLGISTATTFLPYLLFGLIIGAWVDRVDRKRLMIATDIARGLVLASIPLLDAFGVLTILWIYAVGFVSTTLTIGFDSAEFAAIPSLVSRSDGRPPHLSTAQVKRGAFGQFRGKAHPLHRPPDPPHHFLFRKAEVAWTVGDILGHRLGEQLVLGELEHHTDPAHQ